MDIEIKKIILNDFLKSLKKMRDKSVNPVSAVITKDTEVLDTLVSDDLLSFADFLLIDESVDPIAFFKQLKSSIEEKEFVFIKITSIVPQQIYDEIARLSQNGFFDVVLPDSDEHLVGRISNKTNVILAGERDMFANQADDMLNLVNQFVKVEE